MVAEILRDWRQECPLSGTTPADSADAADTSATPSSAGLRTVADSCGRSPEAERALPHIRKHPQASATQQTQATPSDPQVPQVPQPTVPTMAFQRHRLIAAAVAQGIDRSIIDRLDDLDVDGCQWLDEPGLRRYAQIVQENHLAARGVAILHPLAKP